MSQCCCCRTICQSAKVTDRMPSKSIGALKREQRERSRLEEQNRSKLDEVWGSGSARMVRELLDRIEKERMAGSWGKEKQPIPDPFKDLDEFLEMDLSTGFKVVVKIKNEEISEVPIQKSKTNEKICLLCNTIFDQETKLNNHMKNAHGEEGEMMSPKDGQESDKSKEADRWAELEGASYQCLVCLTSIPWTSQDLTQHLLVHKLDLSQYHGVFGPAIQRQIAKDGVAKEKGAKEKEVNTKEIEEKKVEKESKGNEPEEHESKIEEMEMDPTVVEDTSNDTETSKTKHTRSKPFKPKNFDCAICKEEFRWTEPNITSHLKEKHCLTKEFYVSLYVKGANSSEDKFNCDKCMFVSTRKSALTFHVTKYHTEGPKKSCCKKKYIRKWDLFVHLIENHRDDKDLFAKFDIGQSLEKYYVKSAS